MPRAIWSGAISFGLVNVPVKLYSAVSRKSVRFHQLHDADNVRIQQKRVCPADGEEVAYDHIVKGYEIAPDQYVVVTQDELEALDPDASRTIDIQEFVDLEEINPILYDSSYYLAPAAGGQKAYALLVDAMGRRNKVAIAKFVMRTKEYLAAVRADGDVLTLSTMIFHDEVVDPGGLDELPAATGEVADREVKMAEQLISSLETEFDPSRYEDTYRARVLDLIERKAAGQEITVQPAAPAPKATPDLMAALEASIAAVKSSSSGDGDGAKKKPAAKKPRAKAASKG